MNAIIQMIQNLSGKDQKQLLQLKQQLGTSQDIIMSSVEVLPSFLQQIDPAKHTLGYVFLLLPMGALAKSDEVMTLFVRLSAQFLVVCNSQQIRLIPAKFRQLCDLLTTKAIKVDLALSIVKPLQSCIWKVAPGDHVTPQHACFARAVLKAKAYKYALPVLDKYVYEVSPDLTGLKGEDVRLYFYYGGMIYTGLKQFKKALEFFEMVISAPAIVGSKIMSEAYKKYILVSLIHFGEVKSLPKYTNPTVLRLFKVIAKPYEEFSTSYETRSVKDLHKCASNHSKEFLEDGNFGLVKQAIEALNNQNIQRLTKTYLTLSFDDIASKISLDDPSQVEARVFSMIRTGKVFASINQKDGMIAFEESPDNFNSDLTLAEFEKNIKQTIALNEFVNKTDDEIALSERYIRQQLLSEKSPGGGPGRGFDAMDVSATPDAQGMGHF